MGSPTEHGTGRDRSPGLRLIIGYKLVKAVLMFGLAVWLTLLPQNAYRLVARLAAQLATGGTLAIRLARWIEAHLSQKVVSTGGLVAWIDAASTTVEATLLLMGKAWGEWLVIAGLGLLIPAELSSWERRPGVVKLVVLLLNAAVVAYLVRHRLRSGHNSTESK